MDDTSCREFFTRPNHLYQRRYEALRAVFVEGRAAKDVAEQFGLAERTVRQLVYEFRQHCRDADSESPFFATARSADPLEAPQSIRPLRKKSPKSPIAKR
jgi:transposase-like protein